MKKLEIGVAKVSYDKQGMIEQASFSPTMKLDVEPKMLMQLSATINELPEDAHIIKDNTGMVLASWFSKMNEIELADRDQFEVASEIVKCDRYPNGKVKHCEVRFIFRELQSKLTTV